MLNELRRPALRLAVASLIVLTPSELWGLPSFPGAEGAGAEAIGGRGGTVYIVDTLSDDPADGLTFREAVTATGPRYVLFSVSGIIELESLLTVAEPNITIAGQTSPGGIAIVNHSIRVHTSEVIIQHMRFLRGQKTCASVDCSSQGESLYIGNGSNIIVDHCSIKWGTDETLQIGSYWGDVEDVTISWCLIAEGLDYAGHGLGVNLSRKFSTVHMPRDLSFHHNYIAHFRYRIPQWVGPVGPSEFTNNVVYDWLSRQSPMVIPVEFAEYNENGWSGGDIGHTAFLNYTHNYAKIGPNSNEAIPVQGSAELYLNHNNQTPEARIYTTGNIGVTTTTSDDVWRVSEPRNNTDFAPETWRAATPHAMGGIPITATTMTEAYAASVLENVGATRPVRDDTDAAVVATFANGDGDFVDTVDCPGAACPTFQSLSPPADSDGDGMSDAWETSEFGGLSETAIGDEDGDGYDNLEEYLHALSGDQAGGAGGAGGGGTGGAGGAGGTSGTGGTAGSGGAPPTCSDGDGDGYGTPASPLCAHPEPDCDDSRETIHPGASERCNGDDDDCDGYDDEDWPALGDACTTGLGVCQAEGMMVCAAAIGVECNAAEGAPATETCNDLDDDCDGSVDEGVCSCTGSEVRSCYGGPNGTDGVGVCLGGTQTCQPSGTWGTCDGQVLPSGEQCNDGLDNDCDGQADGVDTECGACVDGDTDGYEDAACGGDDCDDEADGVHPGATELCDDAVDNDCNGLVDGADTIPCGGGGAGPVPTESEDDGGCGCRLAGARGDGVLTWLLLVLGSAMFRSLRKR